MHWVNFLMWFKGTEDLRDKVESPPDLLKSDMFITNRETGIGLIRDAEKVISKSSGRPYIKLEVWFTETDSAHVILPRTGYTQYVIDHGLSPSYRQEAFNIANMVGMTAKVGWDHKKMVDGNIYCTCHIKGIIL